MNVSPRVSVCKCIFYLLRISQEKVTKFWAKIFTEIEMSKAHMVYLDSILAFF